MKKLVVLTGAGVSAESGLKTFRDADGLWEGHRVEEVATPDAWERNPSLVLQFYNERRKQLSKASPNLAHRLLAELEKHFKVSVVTQNVDDLHERAGSSKVIHLHGELKKMRSERYSQLVYDCPGDILLGDRCEKGFQLRPHIVWFGESVPLLALAVPEFESADICIIVGTSLQVYPAAGLIGYLPTSCRTYYIDPRPHPSYEIGLLNNITLIPKKAQEGMQEVFDRITS